MFRVKRPVGHLLQRQPFTVAPHKSATLAVTAAVTEANLWYKLFGRELQSEIHFKAAGTRGPS